MVSWYWKGILRIMYNVSVCLITHIGDAAYYFFISFTSVLLFLSVSTSIFVNDTA